MSDLFAAGCSIAPTRRRRFLWAAWWTAPPTREPFRKPDAFQGGARTREEAFQEAALASPVHLIELESSWARAWANVLRGRSPWGARAAGRTAHPGGTATALRPRGPASRPSVWSVLGVPSGASELEIKLAFRKRALETHPDRGGAAEAFHEVQRAYEEALRRMAAPRRRRSR
jgi:hypothetical protein